MSLTLTNAYAFSIECFPPLLIHSISRVYLLVATIPRKQLSKLGFMVGTLHGNKSQRAREEVLTAFRRGQVQTLLATNVAARGLDITGIYTLNGQDLRIRRPEIPGSTDD